ncbi:MFS transporter [uncultured Sphingomonas sp.]|uniref:MFS transporter n=1 Tax=uncultured Sphingomonas sp. TaxID=158754 RepID=UPI0035CC6A82
MHHRPIARQGDPAAMSSGAAPVTIFLCCAIAFLDGADTQAVAIAAPLIARDLAIGPGALGVIFSVSLLGAALGAVGCGSLADRFGPKRVLLLCTLWFGGFQLATAQVDGYAPLFVLRFLAGLGLGGAAPCFLGLAAAQVAPRHRARLLGLLWGCFPIGGFVGGFVNGWIVEHRAWQTVFTVGGVAPLVVAALLAVLANEARRAVAPSGAASPRGDPFALWRDAALRRRMTLLCCIGFGAFGTLAGIVVWMPTILVGAGFRPGQGGVALSWNAVGALVSMTSAGFLLERFGARVLAIGFAAATLLMIGLGLSLGSLVAVAACMALLGVALGVAASGGIAATGASLPAALQSSGLGWAMGMGRLGQVALPLLMGLALQRGIPAGLVLAVSAALPLAGALAALRISATVQNR